MDGSNVALTWMLSQIDCTQSPSFLTPLNLISLPSPLTLGLALGLAFANEKIPDLTQQRFENL